MFWLNTKRIIRTGLLSFWRNGFVSLSSILVVTVTLFTIIVIIFTNVVLESVLADMRSKVDVNVYFVVSAPEPQILAMKDSLNKLAEVSSVKYVSREQALQEFKDKHKDDYLTIQGLDELGDNPLGARLNIVAKDPSQYEGIVKTIEDKNALVAPDQSIIDKVNYQQNKVVIDRLSEIIIGAKQLGFLLALVLMIISVLITFNTIRLVIYMSREEIAVMRLVGASSTYVRGPFIVGGMIYGVISAALAMFLFWPIAIWLARATTDFFGGVNLYTYYIQNFFQIFFIVLMAGIFLGAVSSFLAVRKYLKV
ncbi:MAG: permease-like cell division protein FtsX [Candidatus Paceibacterota bacterium]|jgi:cell division transport system permease protein|nr:ABC transporter permease [Candidatus Paceibacterota bacterium]